MTVQRPIDSGERDSLGRPIKVSAQTVDQRASAPPPPPTSGSKFDVDGAGSVLYPNQQCDACGFELPNHADDCHPSTIGWEAFDISPDDRERWEEAGFTEAIDAFERSHLPYAPAEWRRMDDAGLGFADVAEYTAAGVTRPEAMIAWAQAGWPAGAAARMVCEEGFPGPNGVDFVGRPRSVKYASLAELRADSISEAARHAGDPYQKVLASGGTAVTKARLWDGTAVAVEATYNPNALTGFAVVGASDDHERAVRDRVRAALLNSGMAWPGGRVTVNVSGGRFDSRCDAAIATSILAATGQVHALDSSSEIWGELSLDGRIVDSNMNR